MNSIPKELSTTVEYLKVIKSKYINIDIIRSGYKIIEDFNKISLVPNWEKLADHYCEEMSIHLKEIIDFKKSDYHFPTHFTKTEIVESGTIEEDDEFGGVTTLPNIHFYESTLETNNENLNLWYNELMKVLNEFILACKNHGYEIEGMFALEIIDAITHLKIKDVNFIEHASHDKFKKALMGELTDKEIANAKIQIALTKMEAAYIFSRIKESTKLPLIVKMVELGAFVINKPLSFNKMRSDLSKFINDDKKLIVKTEIDNEIDKIIKML
jgi:hypothetical protein